MENERRKVQMLTAEQLEVFRTCLAQKGAEPPPQPETFMMGGDCTSCIPGAEEVAGKWLFAEGIGARFGRGGRCNHGQHSIDLHEETGADKRRTATQNGS